MATAGPRSKGSPVAGSRTTRVLLQGEPAPARSPTELPGASAAADAAFCREMLPKVSRTFAICIRLLPQDLEHSVLVAYLLCRVADTVEDTRLLPSTEKGSLLSHFSDCVGDERLDASLLRSAFHAPGSDEEILAREADAVLREYRRLSPDHQAAIRPFVREMCAGMAEFTSRQRTAPAGAVALDTVEDLERYCYYVAGTVGHLLTELFQLHSRSLSIDRYRRLKDLATSFGLGLQLTNIIKDVADDQSRGWTFVPRQLCQLVGIRPEQLQDAEHRAQAGRVMHLLIDKAKGHLCDALEYSMRLPRRQYRIRVFCLTSLYFAVRTIRLAELDHRLLDPEHKVKISRREVYRTLRATKLVAPSNHLVRAYFGHLAGDGWGCDMLPAPH